MRDSSRSGSPPVPKRPPVTPGFDWIMTILSAVFISGLFLDGWAHTHGRVDETFFTPWHAVLYGGYLACAVVLLGALAQHAARGYRWRQALPSGYGLSLIGAGLWARPHPWRSTGTDARRFIPSARSSARSGTASQCPGR
jgi:hypothetical protein